MSLIYNNLVAFEPESLPKPAYTVENKVTKPKAQASLPDILTTKQTNDGVGVFALDSIPRATQFGPVDAPLVAKDKLCNQKFLLRLDPKKCKNMQDLNPSNLYLDNSNQNLCNWLMLIRTASLFSEQNLMAHQQEDSIFYTSCRDISPNEELKVWYSPTYAIFLGMPTLVGESLSITEIDDANYSMKGRKQKASNRMQAYMNSLGSERDVRSVPPKKRGWKRSAKEKRPESPAYTSGLFTAANSVLAIKKTRGIQNKCFVCPQCRKSFKNRQKLRIHSVIHSDERNFLCHHCGRTFKRKDKLRNHIITMHFHNTSKRKTEAKAVNLDSYEYKCTSCEIGFHRRGMLINHFIKKHPELPESRYCEFLTRPIVKPILSYKCLYCDKVYKSSCKRKQHIANKHPTQPFPPKQKINEGKMNVISKGCITVEPVCCPYCIRQYSTTNKRNKHVREKHANELQNISSMQNHIQETPKDNLMDIYAVHGNGDVANDNDLLTQAMSAIEPALSEHAHTSSFSSEFLLQPENEMHGKDMQFQHCVDVPKHPLMIPYNNQNIIPECHIENTDSRMNYMQPKKQIMYKTRVLNSLSQADHTWKQIVLNGVDQMGTCSAMSDLSKQSNYNAVEQTYGGLPDHNMTAILEPMNAQDTSSMVGNTVLTNHYKKNCTMSEHGIPHHHILQTVFNEPGNDNTNIEHFENSTHSDETTNWMCHPYNNIPR